MLEKASHALFHSAGSVFSGKFNELKGRLFRAAQLSRKRNIAMEDVIEEVFLSDAIIEV